MKRCAFLLSIVLLTAVLTQAACASDNHLSTQTELNTFKEHCSNLGKQKGYSYQVVQGNVRKTWISTSEIDCLSPKCAEEQKKLPPRNTGTVTHFQVSGTKSGAPPLIIVTPLENESELLRKGPYVTEGKNYALCIRPLNQKSPSGESLFQMDDVTMLEELKN